MQQTKRQKASNKFYSLMAIAAFLLGSIAPAPMAFAAEGDVTVTIVKYINGVQANATTANSLAFPMSATWSAENIGSGTGNYSLDTGDSYQAMTSAMSQGADYSTYEITDGGNVGANCSGGQPFVLAGYTMGDSLESAAAGTPSMTVPSFTGLTSNQYVIVWNKTCVPTPTLLSPADGSHLTTATWTSADWSDVTNNAGPITYLYESANTSGTTTDGAFTSPVYQSGSLATSDIPTTGTPPGTYYWHARAVDSGGNMSPWANAFLAIVDSEATSTPTPTPTSTSTVTVTIVKFIDGNHATASSSGSGAFPMSATWSATNIGAGTGAYTLSTSGYNSPNAYEAVTSDMSMGANYTTSETLGSSLIGAQCGTSTSSTTPSSPANPMFSLMGYQSGNSLPEAMSASSSLTAPAFVGLTQNKFVIVTNHMCGNATSTEGTISGEVGNGVLHVDSIDTIKGDASADGTFASGWKYIFHITIPNNEPNLQMKFSNWTGTPSSTIPVAGNMRLSSAQSDTPTSTVLITAANTYSLPAFHMTSDLNASTTGKQVDVMVEVAVPVGTSDGTYSTTYGVKTQ